MKLVSKHWVYILSCNSLPLRSTPQHDDFDKRKVTKFILFFPIIYRSRSRSPSHIAFSACRAKFKLLYVGKAVGYTPLINKTP